MNGRIAHMHHHYWIVGEHRPAFRLKHLAETRLVKAVDDCLDAAFAGDEQVYILRDFSLQLPLILTEHETDDGIVNRWSEKIAAGIVKMAHQETLEGQHLMRFDSDAHFVCRFLHDLLQDMAWDRWYYFPFSEKKNLPKRQIVAAVLQEHTLHLAKIIVLLQGQGDLEAVLALLDDVWGQRLWQDGVLQGELAAPAAAWRPIFSAALSLLAAFSLPQPENTNALFDTFVAQKVLLPDWQDRLGLAAAVFEALRYLVGQTIQTIHVTLDETLLAEKMAGLDWLDVAWLRQKIHQLDKMTADFVTQDDSFLKEAKEHRGIFDEEMDSTVVVQTKPVGSYLTTAGPVDDQAGHKGTQALRYQMPPRVKQLLSVMMQELTPDRLKKLDGQNRLARTNAVRLFAWVQTALSAENAPDSLDADPLLSSLIEQLLICWVWLATLPLPPEAVIAQLENGRFAKLPMLGQKYQADRGRQFLLMTGQLGAQLMIRLLQGPDGRHALRVETDDTPSSRTAVIRRPATNMAEKRTRLNKEDVIDTQCAGIFLLLRAVLDARLPWLAKKAGYPIAFEAEQMNWLLLMLGKLWAGTDAVVDGKLDEGLLLFAGVEEGISGSDLDAFWGQVLPDNHQAFMAVLLQSLAGQRLVRGESLLLHQLSLKNGRSAFVAAQFAHEGLWPLVIESDGDDAQAVRTLLSDWRKNSGFEASTVISRELWPEIETVSWQLASSGTETAVFQTSESALWAALNTMNATGNFSELVMGLTAVSLLRVWARWLRQFSRSSTPYLLENFIRRPGQIFVSPTEIKVSLQSRPLDIVPQMVGYMDSLEQMPWLNQRKVSFST